MKSDSGGLRNAVEGLINEANGLRAQIAALTAEIAVLREALTPFANFADRFGDSARDDSWVLTRNPSGNRNLTMGDVRRARAALRGKEEKP